MTNLKAITKNLTILLFFVISAGNKLLNYTNMSRKCDYTGKKVSSGNNRPFSLKATKRVFRPNLFKKKMWNPETGKVERMTLSAKAIKTLKKLALKAGKLKDWKAEGAKISAIQKAGAASVKGEGKHVKKEKLTPKQKKELAAKEEEAKKVEMAGTAPVEEVKEEK